MEVYNNNPKGVCNYPFDTATGGGGNAILFLKASLLNRGIPQGDTLQAEPAFTGGVGKWNVSARCRCDGLSPFSEDQEVNNVVEMHAHAPRPARNKVMPGVFQTDRARRRVMPSQSPKAAAFMTSITPRQIAPTLLPEMAGQSHFVPADPSLALDIPDDEARLPAGWFLLPALFLSLFLWAALIYWIAF